MSAPRIAAVVLAAGSSRRMGARNKLLATVRGRPMIEWPARAALGFGADPVVVVTGHAAPEVEAVLPGGVTVVLNPDHDAGLSTSLRAGLRALPEDVDAATILLGDMPDVRAEHLRALAEAWAPGRIAVPVRHGRRGNPVLWSACFFEEMQGVAGDRGARALLDRHPDAVIEVPAVDDAVLLDVDDPDQLERHRASR